MPFFLFILLLLGLDYVVFQILGLALSEIPAHYVLGISIAYWCIPIGFALWWFMVKNKQKNTPLRATFFIIYFAKFLLLLGLIIFQLTFLLVGLIALLIPNFEIIDNHAPFFAKLGIIGVGFPLLLMVYGILRNRHRYKVYKVSVPITNLPEGLEGLKIVQISDVHSGSFSGKEPIKKGIELINQAKADLVFFTGDLVNSIATEVEPYIEVFEEIKAKYGVFSVLGNHDYGDYVRWPNREMKINNLKRLIQVQKSMGWQLLLNQNRLININGEEVAIIGVENYSASPRFSKYGDLKKAYVGAGQADLKLLLSHDPSHWEAQVVSEYADIAITFSGHTHGAQFGIELGRFFKWSPVQYVYKQWAGLYQTGKQFLYVNRGFGYLGYPGRVGILPEITLMTLTNSSKQ